MRTRAAVYVQVLWLSSAILLTPTLLNAAALSGSVSQPAVPAPLFVQTAAPPDSAKRENAAPAGGEYKLEVVNVNGVARARCIAKDSAGRVARLTHSKSLADGAWHQLACARTGSVWAVTVDGATTSKTLPLGSVGNSSALSIGAKLGGKTGGDWFRGDLDEAHLEID